MTIQSVLFDKKKWNEHSALNYLIKHHFKGHGVDNKENHLRYRQVEPDSSKKYYTKVLKNGVEYIMMY